MANGWPSPKLLAETTKARGPKGWIGGKGEPFFAVIAEKGSTQPSLSGVDAKPEKMDGLVGRRPA